jgi:hypothetical protein
MALGGRRQPFEIMQSETASIKIPLQMVSVLLKILLTDDTSLESEKYESKYSTSSNSFSGPKLTLHGRLLKSVVFPQSRHLID